LVRRHVRVLVLLLLAAFGAWLVLVQRSQKQQRQREYGEGLTDQDYAGLRAATTLDGFRDNLALIDPHGALHPYLRLHDDGAELQEAPGGEALAAVSWSLASPVNGAPRVEQLRDLRVLIDPGHFGGQWSEIEKRHIVVGERPPVREGNLTWATARLMEEELRASGAKPVVSRPPPPQSPFPEPPPRFSDDQELLAWLRAHLARQPLTSWLSDNPVQLRLLHDAYREPPEEETPAVRAFFTLFNRFDLRRRSQLAEEIGADITLSIHYNVARDPEVNKVLAFVPGGVLAEEMESGPERYWAFKRAIGDELPTLIELAGAISSAMQEELGVSGKSNEPIRRPPRKTPVDEDNGVFARNLAVLKRTPGLVLLLEGPCMNNPEEHQRLLDDSVQIDGEGHPERARQYARAAVRGLKEKAALIWDYRARHRPESQPTE